MGRRGRLSAAVVLLASLLVALLLWLSREPSANSVAPTASEHSDANGEQRAIELGKPLDHLQGSTPSATAERQPLGSAAAQTLPGPTGSLRVRVVADDDGQPLEGVLVRVHRWGPGTFSDDAAARSDAQGVALFTRLRAGPLAVAADQGRFDIYRPPSAVVAGECADHELRVSRGVAVHGSVRRDEQPVAHAEVWIMSDWAMHLATRCDDAGRFNLERVAPGSRLLAFAQGYGGDAELDVRHTIGGPSVVELELDERVRPLVGRVLAPDGHDAPHARVRVGVLVADANLPEPDPRWMPLDVRCDELGRFKVDVAPAGFALRVLAQSDLGAPTIVEVEVNSPPNDELVVRLAPGAELRGVLTFNGQPAADALAIVVVDDFAPGYPDDEWFTAISDASGRYSIRGLPAGAHMVGAMMPLATDDPWAWAKVKTDKHVAQAREQLEFPAGATVDWNATLERKQ